MNNCVFIGHLGQDPEIKYVNDTALCNFSVAVRGRKKDETIWVSVSVWGKNAENCQTYLAKGKKVCVVGSVSVRAYKKNNGEAGASLELNANQVEFLSEKSEDANGQDAILSHDSIPF